MSFSWKMFGEGTYIQSRGRMAQLHILVKLAIASETDSLNTTKLLETKNMKEALPCQNTGRSAEPQSLSQ